MANSHKPDVGTDTYLCGQAILSALTENTTILLLTEKLCATLKTFPQLEIYELLLEHGWEVEKPRSSIRAKDAVDWCVDHEIDGNMLLWEAISRESEKHLGLVLKEISKLAKSYPNETADMLGYGWRGLRAALLNYDPELGYSFSTYACPKINGAIRDGIRAENPLPKRLHTYMRKVTVIEEQLTHTLQRKPTYEEITQKINEPAKDFQLVQRAQSAKSIDQLEDYQTPFDNTNIEQEVMIQLATDKLNQTLSTLTPQAKILIERTLQNGEKISLVADDMNLSLKEAKKLRAEAIKDIKNKLNPADISVLLGQ